MKYMPWMIAGIMAIFIVILIIKIYIMRKSAEEIIQSFKDRLSDETNTLIDISSGDRYMRRLANEINIQLKKLRALRHRYKHGDEKLKNAITNISHDLRTPLTAISGYTELLEKEESTEAAKRYIGIIKNRTEIMKKLTEELFVCMLPVSGENEIKKEAVVINCILEDCIAAFYTDFCKHNIEPVIHMPEIKVVRHMDSDALSRIFSNLINNAIKYSDGDLEIDLYESGEIVFSNAAHRLNELYVSKLFDRFYTVETGSRGTGLGLYIVKTLVENMNGKISAKYEAGRLNISVMLPEGNMY